MPISSFWPQSRPFLTHSPERHQAKESGPLSASCWHGVPFARPLQRTREVIDIVRMIARGERLTYTGEIYHLPLPGDEGKALVSIARPRPNLPIYLATLGPKNLELMGELADGWLGTFGARRTETYSNDA